jgi:N-acetylglucosaminyldiphosphoundecaprenol N-acetyl-beta-D-mannosaminyltransferase
VVTGMHGVVEATKDPEFKDLVNSADLFVPDGISLVWVSRLRGRPLKRRVSGADLMWECLKLSEKNGYGNFFYGDTPETLEHLRVRLNRDLPNLKISGLHSPPFRQLTDEEKAQEIEMINSSGADILWIGLGLPKQERWIAENQHILEVSVAVGVGAAFKFLAGTVRRAPAWIGNSGFEWLWRLFQEPKLVWRRVFLDGPRFAYQIALELTRLRRYD